MGIIGRLFRGKGTTAAYDEGRAMGSDLAADIEWRWSQLRADAGAMPEPAARTALFLGWMQGLHRHLVSLNTVLHASEPEIQEQWLWICSFYRNSFARSIVISCAFYRNFASVIGVELPFPS